MKIGVRDSKSITDIDPIEQYSESGQQGKFAVIAIYYNYIFDNETDLTLREWDKIRYQDQIKEYVYNIAHRLQGAVFLDDMVSFFIVTSKDIMEEQFLKQNEHIKLLKLGQKLAQYRVFIGIGLGDNMLEAKLRSTMALNHSFQDHKTRAYIASNEKNAMVTDMSGLETVNHSLNEIAKKCGLSVTTLINIKKAVERTGNPVKSEDLAEATGLNVRSINRILNKLEDVRCATVIAKESNGKGRPARIIKLTLP